MTCADYVLHESECRHRLGRFDDSNKSRIRFADGCTATWCLECFAKFSPSGVVEISRLGAHGIPLDERAWTLGDAVANAIIEIERPRTEAPNG